ncbi:hypothetical protein JKP88DRAFT_252065 [Tribonema minus]|uniref:Uncharacterized protein n=1 Tax=Tribonema minus TaxID=303371 RepID=A0A836CPB1_9STRA|nr:hypothetical protein JKP88DRAFT_252065 [Tribonema minus]
MALQRQWATPQGQLLGLIAVSDDDLSGVRQFGAQWAASESVEASGADMRGIRLVDLTDCHDKGAHRMRRADAACRTLVLCPLAIQPDPEPTDDDSKRKLDLQPEPRLDMEGLVASLPLPRKTQVQAVTPDLPGRGPRNVLEKGDSKRRKAGGATQQQHMDRSME